MIKHDREFAWRIFAGEYNKATLELPSVEERAPGYLITPLGAKINRVYIVGVLTEVEKLERNGNINYRARVSDRTGVFYIYAGQYEPKVSNILSKLEPPVFVSVIGKARRYSPTEDVSYVSIRPENIIEVDKNVRDYWLLDTCKSMKTRLEVLVEAQKMDEPNTDNLTHLGFDLSLAESVLDAMAHYDKIDVQSYKDMMVDVLKYLVVDNGVGVFGSEDSTNTLEPNLELDFKTCEEYESSETGLEDDENTFEFEQDTNDGLDENDHIEEKEQLLNIIKEFDTDEFENGVPWHNLVAKADSDGLDKNIIEDLINDLLNRGKVYEPMLGRIKATN